MDEDSIKLVFSKTMSVKRLKRVNKHIQIQLVTSMNVPQFELDHQWKIQTQNVLFHLQRHRKSALKI
jgi:hypothetical protein